MEFIIMASSSTPFPPQALISEQSGVTGAVNGSSPSSAPQPLDLSLPKKPLRPSSSPKPSPLGSINALTKPTSAMPSGTPVQPVNNEASQCLDLSFAKTPARLASQNLVRPVENDDTKESRGNLQGEKQDPAKQTVFPLSAEFLSFLSLLNLQVKTAPSLPSSVEIPTTSSAAAQSRDSPSCSVTAVPNNKVKRKRSIDIELLRRPLEFGWRRETRIRSVDGRLTANVSYFAPNGRIMHQYIHIMKYLAKDGCTELSQENFSFKNVKIGDFYEASEGPEGQQWRLLPEDEIAPIIRTDGKRNTGGKQVVQPADDAREVGQQKSAEDASSLQNKGTKKSKKRKRDDGPSTCRTSDVSCAKKAKTQNDKKDVAASQQADKERLRKEEDERQLKLERRRELRRLQQRKAKEAKKMKEDLCSADQKGCSSAQHSRCIQQQAIPTTCQPAIPSWYCQFCLRRDREDLLLLCDGCDRGCHTYCLQTQLFTIPDGDWFCPSCIMKESGEEKRSTDTNQNAELINKQDVSRSQNKGTNKSRKRKRDDCPSTSQASDVSCAKKAKTQDD